MFRNESSPWFDTPSSAPQPALPGAVFVAINTNPHRRTSRSDGQTTGISSSRFSLAPVFWERGRRRRSAKLSMDGDAPGFLPLQGAMQIFSSLIVFNGAACGCRRLSCNLRREEKGAGPGLTVTWPPEDNIDRDILSVCFCALYHAYYLPGASQEMELGSRVLSQYSGGIRGRELA